MRRGILNTIKRYYLTFKSAKSTVFIISVLLLLYFTGLLIPQKAYIPSPQAYADWKSNFPLFSTVVELFQLNEIYLAPITIFFLVLFFINLLVVLGHRLPTLLKRMYIVPLSAQDRIALVGPPPDDARLIPVPTGGPPIDETVLNFLKKRFWTVVGGDRSRSFFAVKNRYSPLGFLFFHTSFLLCLAGGLLVFFTRFTGAFILTEGQEFTPEMKNFHRIYQDAKLMKKLPPFSMRLEKALPQYENNVSTDLDVDIALTDEDRTETVRVKVNQPVKRGALSILARDVGVAPLMVLRDRAGREIAGSFFSLNVMKGDEDSFDYPDIPYVFTVRFYPDYVEREGKPFSRSRMLSNPVIQIGVTKNQHTIFAGLLPIKHHITFDGLTLSFEEVRYWVEFYVIREYGNYALIAGFLLGVTGLIMRLIFYQRTLRLFVFEGPDGLRLALSGKSEYYPHSFQHEIAQLAESLEKQLAQKRDEEGGPSSSAPLSS